MEHWEFLLQKEGDRSWLPLDSPDVEILEGRYRIVARSSNVNAIIDTRIAHLATAEVPPKRRVQKRSCRTNHDGLMVVIPFTHLEPGQWELSCSPTDLMTDLMAGAQPYALKLQVVAREPEEDWEPDWTPLRTASENTASETITLPPFADDGVALASESSMQSTVPLTSEVKQASAIDTQEFASPAADTALSDGTSAQPNVLPPDVAAILAASMDRLFQVAEQMSERLVDDVLQDFDLATIADTPVPANAVDSPNDVTSAATIAANTSGNHSNEAGVIDQSLPSGYTLAAHETFRLTLDQAAFVATRGDVITLSGQIAISPAPPIEDADQTLSRAIPSPNVDAGSPWDRDSAISLTGATAREIQLCLRDPQSLQVLVSDRQRLSSPSFPYAFTFSFSLPETFATHLVLGEVLLCGMLLEQADAPIALLTQSFSITVDPNVLVGELTKLHEALAMDVDEEERIDLPLELSARLKEQATPSLDLSFLSATVVEPPAEQTPRFASLSGHPLPPQLYQPSPEQLRSKALDLPAFTLTTEVLSPLSHEPTLPEAATSNQSSSDSIAVDEAVPLTGASEAALIPTNPLTAAPEPEQASSTEPLPPRASTEVNADSPGSPSLALPSPTHMAFQSLKLQDRFLTRLASLATDTELSAMLKANLEPGSTFAAPTVPFDAAARSLAEEIVVDDEEPPQKERRRAQPTSTSEQRPLDEPPSALVLPADDPVPMPHLDVTTGELIAGKPTNIRVKLPSLLPRIYVKLWVTDRQTRSLLDGPRWLVDFLPNGLGALETMMPLTVPFGSVELRFEAIAVEMHTQRESHKVTIDRVVVPPDLPFVSLDDFSD